MIKHKILTETPEKKDQVFEWSLEKDPEDGTPRLLINGKVVFYVGRIPKQLFFSKALIEDVLGLTLDDAGFGPDR